MDPWGLCKGKKQRQENASDWAKEIIDVANNYPLSKKHLQASMWQALNENLDAYIKLRNDLMDRIVNNERQINILNGEIKNMQVVSLQQQILDKVNEINIFGSAIINSAPAFLSGDYILGLEMFIQNINVQSLAEYAYDLQHDSYRIDRAEVYQQIVSNSKKMMLLKAENAGNAELLRNYQKEINNLKRRINAL